MGYDIKRSPYSLIYHKGSVTMKRLMLNPLGIFLSDRNRLINLFIFYSRLTLFKIAPLILLDEFKKMMVIIANIFTKRQVSMSLLKAHIWIILNLGRIIGKRRTIQAGRKVKDSEIISLLSYRFTDKRGMVANIFNGIAYMWCKLARIRTYDMKTD